MPPPSPTSSSERGVGPRAAPAASRASASPDGGSGRSRRAGCPPRAGRWCAGRTQVGCRSTSSTVDERPTPKYVDSYPRRAHRRRIDDARGAAATGVAGRHDREREQRRGRRARRAATARRGSSRQRGAAASARFSAAHATSVPCEAERRQQEEAGADRADDRADRVPGVDARARGGRIGARRARARAPRTGRSRRCRARPGTASPAGHDADPVRRGVDARRQRVGERRDPVHDAKAATEQAGDAELRDARSRAPRARGVVASRAASALPSAMPARKLASIVANACVPRRARGRAGASRAPRR